MVVVVRMMVTTGVMAANHNADDNNEDGGNDGKGDGR